MIKFVSDAGLKLIKEHEGLRLASYLCPGKKWTIGYGHTLTARAGQTISKERAEQLLANDIVRAEACVRRQGVDLTQPMFDALVSFVFNMGGANFTASTMLRHLKSRQWSRAAAEFPKWVWADDKISNGLSRRRHDEQQLFLSGIPS